jgi:4-amino-4-deoxy-L-arabinose transferase-like glycosyltransferase
LEPAPVLLVFLLACTIFDRRAATLAALVVAVYPYYVAHDTTQQEPSSSRS